MSEGNQRGLAPGGTEEHDRLWGAPRSQSRNEITSSLPRGVLDRERREEFLSVHVDAVLADLRVASRLKTGPPCSHVIQGPAGTGKSNVIRHIIAASGADFAACTIDMCVPPTRNVKPPKSIPVLFTTVLQKLV